MVFPANLQGQFIAFLDQNKIFRSAGWNNFMETVDNAAAVVVEVTTVEQLQNVLKEIKRINELPTSKGKITVRATGGWSDDNVSQCCLFPWSQKQINTYNEGFSFSQVVGGRATPETPGTDVILRFAKKYHHMEVLGSLPTPKQTNPESPIHKLPCSLVKVSAGVQVAELVEFLRKKGLSLTTVSMISWVTAVGLAGTGGHGTGRDEPAFSGLIESFEVCDMDGNLREITSTDPDFQVLSGAHSGLLGVVTSIKIRAVEAYNLKETIRLFSNVSDMDDKLDEILKENQYVSIMGMPTYGNTSSSVHNWQVREWNHTLEKPKKIVAAPYDPDAVSFNQELEVELGASTLDFLIDSGLKQLLPHFMLLSAAMITGTRGTEPRVDYENHITHPQVAFPKKMRDVSYLIPVKDDEAGKHLKLILLEIEKMLNECAKNGKFPITYAIYVRYINGTNGGLSTTGTINEDERILAIDMVTHPEAPGISLFEQQFMQFLKENGFNSRHHLGKNFPYGIETYTQFLDSEEMEAYFKALLRWYKTPDKENGLQRLSNSPFVTPYMEKMLTVANPLTLRPEQGRPPRERPHKDHTEVERRDFLVKLHAGIKKRAAPNPAASEAQTNFLAQCQAELDKLNLSIEQQQRQPQPI